MDVMAATSTAEERARRYREYVEALEEERRKIQVFQRELPLSLQLITQTIESCKQQMAVELFATGGGSRSEVDEEETSSEGAPVLEEFIPLKGSCFSEADDDNGSDSHHRHPCRRDQENGDGSHNEDDSISTNKQKQEDKSEEKPDWLRSVQLWSQHPDPHSVPIDEDDVTPRRPIVVEAKKHTGAFQPFQRQKRSPPPAAAPTDVTTMLAVAPTAPAASSTSDSRGGGKGGVSVVDDEKDGNPHRKTRRCWSPELHRRFLDALRQLGGSHVATPKQIRELMKVDGLTNDEVKSHLQKYRLHSRRPSPTSQSNAGNPPPQQVVFVGGIWVPPPEYAAAAVAAAAGAVHPPAEGIVGPPIYAPVASVPTPMQRQAKQPQGSPSGPLPTGGRGGRDEQRPVDDDDATRSNSPATSSSSHTTTTSPHPQCS